MAVWEIGWRWRVLCHSRGVKVNQPNTPLFLQIPMTIRMTSTSTSTRWSHSFVVAQALDPKREDQNSSSSTQEEDLVYVGKLVAGSFAGGAAIKYGSALFPQITTPNLVLALLIILTPVLISLFLLFKESSRSNPS